jgi:RNA polymerase sigma-70 factor (ECF subfamily)
MARGAREIGESYLAGHLHPDATDAAPQMRSVAIDYFGRSRRRGIEIVEALDRLLHQPPAATLRVDLSAAPQPSGDDDGLAQVRQGKMLEYDDLVRLEDVVVRRELAQVLNGLGRTPEATTLVELQPAALYLALAQEIVGVSDIYRDAALDEPRMRRVFYQRAANAASRAAELARQGGSLRLNHVRGTQAIQITDGGCLEIAGPVPEATPQPNSVDERLVIRRAQRGDRLAFEQLVRLYEANVFRLALQLTRSEDEARDLYQEAFLKIYRSLGRFRFESRFSTWVYRVVMNVCLDHLRRASRRREQQAPETSDSRPEFFHGLPENRAAHNPEQAYRGKEIARRLETALARLSPRERLVFELKHYQGMRLRAIGQVCGTSEENAKNSLFRATRKLRTELQGLI